jgi:hypothetical protein
VVFRRSIYRVWPRTIANPLLEAFDCPQATASTPVRAVSLTPVQLLTHWNDAFVLAMADRFAQRLAREAGDDPARQVDLAFRLAYQRWSTDVERKRCAAFVAEHGAWALCRVILNASEFLFVE